MVKGNIFILVEYLYFLGDTMRIVKKKLAEPCVSTTLKIPLRLYNAKTANNLTWPQIIQIGLEAREEVETLRTGNAKLQKGMQALWQEKEDLLEELEKRNKQLEVMRGDHDGREP
jgi:hypothetical protein